MFDNDKQWNGYKLGWCSLCDVAIITCPKCQNTSCNGGGCRCCQKDFNKFDKSKTCVVYYLSDEELKGYQKGRELKGYILDSLAKGEAEIDWAKMKEQGKFSKYTEELFAEKLSQNRPIPKKTN